ncbi:MAG: IS110 family transposase [Prevotellaceae bacterium]|jgi:transposase|nr:IS110 family transposase [Prevotellaceae bacterium]
MAEEKKKEVVEFEVVNHHGAGIDVGSREIYVSIDGQQVVSFPTFTDDYRKCCEYLQRSGTKSVAMEATGVYWMSLYDMLEQHGIRVCLVHPREVQQVKGRKTDVSDCQWIQRLFAAGMLRESIVAEGLLKEMRVLVRERGDLIAMGATYVNKMQKFLELMNIKLRNVISQVHGESGLRVIRAILAGERSEEALLQLCHGSIRTRKPEDFKKALRGNYSKRYLLLLQENLRLWEEHQQSVRSIEKQIELLLLEMGKDKQDIVVDSPACPARHHNPQIEDLHTQLVQQYSGVNLCSIAGINDSTMLRLLGEIGTDMSRFPTVKHFVSWLGLSPKNKQSGKMKRRVKAPKGSCAGEIFRQSAQALSASKYNAIGAFIRRLRGRKGSYVAIKAGARKIAIAVYNALTRGMDYVEAGAAKYQEQLAKRELYALRKLALKHNFVLVEN